MKAALVASNPPQDIELKQSDLGFQQNLYIDPNPTRRWLHNARREWVISKLDHYTSCGSEKIIEVGVGCGIFTRHLSECGCQILAVDTNMKFLKPLLMLPGVSMCHHDVTKGLLVSGYDVALCSEVIEHVPHDRSELLLRSIYNSLRPGGILILSTPQSFSTMEMAARLLRFKPILSVARRLYGHVDDLGHVNLLTRYALKRQIFRTGFRVIEETRLGLYLPLLAETRSDTSLRVAKFMERNLRNIPLLSGLLWTQCYVLQKPA